MARFLISPEKPVQGDPVTVFVHLESEFESSDEVRIFLTGELDSSPLSLLHPSKDLWLARIGPFSNIGAHTLRVTTWLEDYKEAQATRDAILKTNQEILIIETRLPFTADPGQKAVDQARLEQCRSLLTVLHGALDQSKKSISSDSLTFEIAPNDGPQSPFPRISSVSPNFAYKGASSTVTIKGRNFAPGAEVRIAGVKATTVAIDPTTVVAIIPGIGTPGPWDVTVTVPGQVGEFVSAILKDGFFVLDGTEATKNHIPVAFAGTPQKVVLGGTVTLDGSLSYDEDPEDHLTYEWSIVSRPLGSMAEVSSDPTDKARATFIPDVFGSYNVSLVVSDGKSRSVPSLTTIEVLGLTVSSGPIRVLAPANGCDWRYFALKTPTPNDSLEVRIINVSGAAFSAGRVRLSRGIGETWDVHNTADTGLQVEYCPNGVIAPEQVMLQVFSRGQIEFTSEIPVFLGSVPSIGVKASVQYAHEGGAPGVFTITRTDSTTVPLSSPLVVGFVFSGQVKNGIDFASVPERVTFAAGQSSVDVAIVPIDDKKHHRPRTLVLKLAEDDAYSVGLDFYATMTIVDSRGA